MDVIETAYTSVVVEEHCALNCTDIRVARPAFLKMWLGLLA